MIEKSIQTQILTVQAEASKTFTLGYVNSPPAPSTYMQNADLVQSKSTLMTHSPMRLTHIMTSHYSLSPQRNPVTNTKTEQYGKPQSPTWIDPFFESVSTNRRFFLFLVIVSLEFESKVSTVSRRNNYGKQNPSLCPSLGNTTTILSYKDPM